MKSATSIPVYSKDKFVKSLRNLLNRHSQENGSNTPDFILAEYMRACLCAFEAATQERERWYGHSHKPGGVSKPFSEEDAKS